MRVTLGALQPTLGSAGRGVYSAAPPGAAPGAGLASF